MPLISRTIVNEQTACFAKGMHIAYMRICENILCEKKHILVYQDATYVHYKRVAGC